MHNSVSSSLELNSFCSPSYGSATEGIKKIKEIANPLNIYLIIFEHLSFSVSIFKGNDLWHLILFILLIIDFFPTP